MKKFVLLLVICLFAIPAFATPTVTLTGLTANKIVYSGFPGGAVYAGEMVYRINGTNGETLDGFDVGDTFTTFCVEAKEHVSIGGTYDAVLAPSATHGGFGGGDPDPISLETAWLYNNYLENVLGSSTPATAGNYQVAIWWLEDEILTNYTGTGVRVNESTLSSGVQALINNAEAAVAGGWQNLVGIQVARLFGEGTYDGSSPVYRQDMLICPVGGGIPIIPAPGAVVLAGIGVGFVGWLRKFRGAL